MTASPVLKRLLDTGMQYTEMSQKNAEKIVSEFVKAGQVRRKDAEKVVQRLVDRGRSATEHLVGVVQAEVANQLGRLAERLDDIEARVEDVAGSFGIGRSSAAKSAPRPAAGPSGVAKVVARKASAQKASTKKASTAKKSSAKKSTAKKSSIKKASAKKAPAKK
ncbi:MAG: hypothetical protein QOE09_1194 [Ilumatobacteraceae bacterium]|jgi:polyhydroxyalkanoate synthesis regulator phasin